MVEHAFRKGGVVSSILTFGSFIININIMMEQLGAPIGPSARVEVIRKLKEGVVSLYKSEGLSDEVVRLCEECIDEYQIALRAEEFGSFEDMALFQIEIADLYLNIGRPEKALELLKDLEEQANYQGSEELFARIVGEIEKIENLG